jgi:hypothetical protein
LALRVIRVQPGAVLLALAIGALPIAAINVLLVTMDTPAMEDFFDQGRLQVMLFLVIWELPLATAPLTLYLGQSLFMDRPERTAMVRNFFRSLPQLLWFQVFWRGILTVTGVGWLLMYLAWPYMNEVILLERNPMWRGRRKRMTAWRRIRAVHSGASGEVVGRGLAAAGISLLLAGSLCGSLWVLQGMLFSHWEATGLTVAIVAQTGLWLVAGFFSVVRFLSYLDLRIRREGWEVELLMRAEKARLERQWA